MFRDFREMVNIGDVQDIKLSALNKYRSQMIKLIDDSRWLTLSDVSDGDFVDCFFQQKEIFFSYRL